MADNRRAFVKKGLLGGLLLTAGGAGFLAVRGGKDVAPTEPLLVFTPKTFSIMVAVAETVLPFPSATPAVVAHRVDQSLSFAPKRVQGDVQSALNLLENGLSGVLFRRQTSPFSTLSVEDRGIALNRWRDSSITLLRGGYHAIRKLAIAGHYSALEKAKETGYPGPPFEKGPLWALEDRRAISPPFVVTPPGSSPTIDTPAADASPADTPANDLEQKGAQAPTASDGATP